MTIDLGTGFYLRSEGQRLLFGAARPDQADGYDVSVDWPWMESVLRIGVSRFPWLAVLPLDRAACWAGTYEINIDVAAAEGAALGLRELMRGQRPNGTGFVYFDTLDEAGVVLMTRQTAPTASQPAPAPQQPAAG